MNVINKVMIFGILVFFTAINISCSQAKTDNIITFEKTDKINEIVSLYSDYEGFNGSILVAYEGEIIYGKGFGLANMEWEIPNQVDTKFQIASITKQFTAILIMQLVSENKLDLHKPISTYLPDYPKENGEQITIHQLLTHSSGITDVRHEEKVFRPKEMVNQFADEPLQFTPGEQFSYSNSGYTLLGYIIETITNESYEEVLHDNILKPLNMKNTGFYRHRPLIKNMSSGYNKVWGDYFNIDYSDESSAYAAGAIYSTAEDLFLWDQALYTEKLLPKKYMDLIFSKHITASFGGHYGYGWELTEKPIGNTSNSIETIGHSGTISGYCALFTRIPSSNSTIILLNNTRRAYLNAITTAVSGILYNQPYDFPRKPLARFMLEVIENEGIKKGILFYKEHKDLDDYYISEQELIVVGYKLLHSENAQYAAEVFKLSTEVFPNKDNPYDSYGEALLVLGDTIKAIKNYKKSVKLNPNNRNGLQVLKELGIDIFSVN